MNYNPLFWRLSAEDRAKLMMYQWDTYGELLDLPPAPKTDKSEWKFEIKEGTEEFAKLMKETPKRMRRIE